MKQNNIPGYSLLMEEELIDVKGTGLYFKHVKSGARVCVIKNNDENKVFYVAFRTTPTDSTGVAHIIEHTVLCGSEKYPVKDPFIELEKGSLNTFLNAITFSDKTVYPVASCNDKDFANLCDVYMDAVFHPNIYKKQEIFKQEGWHYELESEDDEIKYNGIVYSEMKGAYSSPDDLFYRCIANKLFPDNAYGVDSGGDPAEIPDLTYDNYLQFHRTYYHPCNSYIYIYGDVDVEERLAWLDKEYLSSYEEIDIDTQVGIQKEFGGIIEAENFYSVDEPDENGKGVFYALDFFAGETDDLVKGIGFEVLDYVLCSAPGAPIKEALLEAGIGDDIISYYSGERRQPTFTIGVKNAAPGLSRKFKKVVFDTLEKCVREGLKEASLRAAINTQEFKYREADFGRLPKGLMYGITCLSTWLYDDNMPFTTLHMNEAYADVKAKIGTGWFEELISKYFLNSKHGVLFTFSPKVGMNAEADAKTKEKLAEYKKSLSSEQIRQLVEDTKALKKYQSEESTPEQLATIPLLDLSDVRKETRPFNKKKVFEDVGEVIFTEYDTNGVCYIKTYFDANGVRSEDASYIGLLSDCLTMVSTKQHGYQELNDLINIYTGGIGTDVGTYGRYNDADIKPYLSVGVKTTLPEAERAIGYLQEVITETLFDDEKRLKELLLMIRTNIESDIMYSGTSIASARAASYISESACFLEATDGIDFYRFICDITDNFDKKKATIISKLKEICSELIRKGNCRVHVTSDEEGLKACEAPLKKLLSVLPEGKSEKALKFTPERKNEAFKTPARVQYNVCTGNMFDAGFKYSGSIEVLKHMLSCGYLWNEIRVKGGAYGAGFSVGYLTGRIVISSYRDPNLTKTYDTFRNLVDYVADFQADERELNQAKVGVFGTKDAPLTPRQMGERSFSAYMQNITVEELQHNRDEIFSCTVEDIRKNAEILKAIIDQNCICTVGSAAEIDKNKSRFLNIDTLV
ncbi:MAG: insulinase family protein [Lachnospiraceae bacterium]|nr:insulinase family protein [Lachnospiraceae bacterium]